MSAAAKAAHKEWTLEVLERFTCELQALFPHKCDGVMDACHIIPKVFLKHIGADSEATRLRIMFDTRNGLAGCRAGHNILDGPYCPVTFDQLPDGVIDFAEENGILWRLEKMYPPKAEAA